MFVICLTQPVVTVKQGNTWNISGMFLVLWPITVKIWTGKLATKPQTSLVNVLACSLLSHPWLAFFFQHNDIPDIFLVLTFSWFYCKKIKTWAGRTSKEKLKMGKSIHQLSNQQPVLLSGEVVENYCAVLFVPLGMNSLFAKPTKRLMLFCMFIMKPFK